MKLPLVNVPISRKVVATFIVAGVSALLRTLGVYDASADLTAWITAGAGLAAGFLVGEGVRYLNYAAEQLHLPVTFDDEA